MRALLAGISTCAPGPADVCSGCTLSARPPAASERARRRGDEAKFCASPARRAARPTTRRGRSHLPVRDKLQTGDRAARGLARPLPCSAGLQARGLRFRCCVGSDASAPPRRCRRRTQHRRAGAPHTVAERVKPIPCGQWEWFHKVMRGTERSSCRRATAAPKPLRMHRRDDGAASRRRRAALQRCASTAGHPSSGLTPWRTGPTAVRVCAPPPCERTRRVVGVGFAHHYLNGVPAPGRLLQLKGVCGTVHWGFISGCTLSEPFPARFSAFKSLPHVLVHSLCRLRGSSRAIFSGWQRRGHLPVL